MESNGRKPITSVPLTWSSSMADPSLREMPWQVYQANAISIGKEARFTSVSRCVIDAVFDRFPDVSGATRFVSARGEKCMR